MNISFSLRKSCVCTVVDTLALIYRLTHKHGVDKQQTNTKVFFFFLTFFFVSPLCLCCLTPNVAWIDLSLFKMQKLCVSLPWWWHVESSMIMFFCRGIFLSPQVVNLPVFSGNNVPLVWQGTRLYSFSQFWIHFRERVTHFGNKTPKGIETVLLLAVCFFQLLRMPCSALEDL